MPRTAILPLNSSAEVSPDTSGRSWLRKSFARGARILAPARLAASRRRRWLLFWAVVALRLIVASYLLVLGASHAWYAEIFGPASRQVLDIWQPRACAGLFFAMAAAHVYSLATACWSAGRGRRLRRSRFAVLRRLDELFGIRGKYFAELIVLAELVELASQTGNLFNIAGSGVAAADVRSFAWLLAISAVLTPLCLLSNNINIHRDTTVLVDAVMDVAFGVGWYAWLVFGFLLQAVRCGGYTEDTHAIVDSLSLVQQLFVNSAPELLLRLMPHLSAHVLLMELSAAVMLQDAGLRTRQQQQQRAPLWMRRAGLAAGAAFAAGVLGLTYARTGADRCAAQPLCTNEAFPLTTGECVCQYLDADCAAAGPLDAAGVAAVDAAVLEHRDTLRALNVDHCGLSRLPAATARADRMWMCIANGNAIAEAPEIAGMTDMFSLQLTANRLTDLPVAGPDSALVFLSVIDNDIRGRPRADLGDDMPLLSVLYLSDNPGLTELPCEWGAQLDMLELYASGTNITELAEGCFGNWAGRLMTLGLGATGLQRLPPELHDLPELQMGFLGGSPACALPADERRAAIGASMDTVRADVCDAPCGSRCEAFRLDNSYCDEWSCGDPACAALDDGCFAGNECSYPSG